MRRWRGKDGESVNENWKKDQWSSIFLRFSICLCLLYGSGWPRKEKKRCRVKYKGFNEASHHLPVTHTLSGTHTHTLSLTASLFTAPSLGLFSHSPLLWRCNKTDKRQMASEELLLQAAFSRHLVIQPVS